MDVISFAIYSFFWLLGFMFLSHIPLCRSKSRDRTTHPSVSVIVPARDEETRLPQLLFSLVGQSLAPDEVIVVDDESSDRTGEIAREAGAEVIESQPLPEGWTGKAWACHQGAQAAKGETLVFLDADTALHRDGLKAIIDTYAQADGVLSVQPYHETRRLYEELSAFFNIVMMGAVKAFTVFGRLVRPPALFGPCLVIQRKLYFQCGGHEMVKGSVLEDVALARQLRRQHVPIRCCGGKGALSFRMYPGGMSQLIQGWSKGFALGAAQVGIPSLFVVAAWLTGSIAAARYFAQAVATLSGTPTLMWGLLYFGYAVQVYWMLFRIGSFRPYTALVYPLPLLFFLVVFAYSLVLVFVRRRVTWKRRTVPVRAAQRSDGSPPHWTMDRGA